MYRNSRAFRFKFIQESAAAVTLWPNQVFSLVGSHPRGWRENFDKIFHKMPRGLAPVLVHASTGWFMTKGLVISEAFLCVWVCVCVCVGVYECGCMWTGSQLGAIDALDGICCHSSYSSMSSLAGDCVPFVFKQFSSPQFECPNAATSTPWTGQGKC